MVICPGDHCSVCTSNISQAGAYSDQLPSQKVWPHSTYNTYRGKEALSQPHDAACCYLEGRG
jgi:hypothetical protein